MIVLDQDFGELPCVWDRFFADEVLNEGFLEQGVSAIFFIGEDGTQVAGGPVCGSNGVLEPTGHQRQTDIPDAFSGKVPFKNPPDSFCFLRNDHRIPVGPFFIAQQGFVLEGDFAVFDGLALAPADIGGDGFALGLCEGGVERDEEFTFRIDGVDVLLLEDHGDAKAPQLTGVADGIQRISGEAGDRFGKDHVDLALSALADHTQEILTPAGGGSRDALIREDIHHCPLRIFHDLFGVEGFLVFVAGQLLLITGGDAAIGGNTQIPLLGLFLRGFLFCRNDDDLLFRLRLCHAHSRSFYCTVLLVCFDGMHICLRFQPLAVFQQKAYRVTVAFDFA